MERKTALGFAASRLGGITYIPALTVFGGGEAVKTFNGFHGEDEILEKPEI